MSTRLSALRPLFVAVSVAALTACGGGGGDSSPSPSPSPTPTPAPSPTAGGQSVSGAVIDGPVQGATVCVDLNRNGVCDPGEPVSSPTDAAGKYTISGLTQDQASNYPLVATIPATAVDGGTKVGTAYAMTAPAGQSTVISPITTMVQDGIAAGLTAATSQATVAAQLQVGTSTLYGDYTASTSDDNTTLASLAGTIVSGLQTGQAPTVGTVVTTPTPSYNVRQFTYTDASNYTLHYFYSTHLTDSTGMGFYYDERAAKSNGVTVPAASLYDSALIATPNGWLPFNAEVANTSSSGSPYISVFSYGYKYQNTSVSTDVSGKSVASVVAMAQDLTSNTASTLIGVNAAQLNGSMPTGSKINRIVNTAIATPVVYRVSDGTVGTVATLDALVSNYPVPAGTATSSNTVSMGNMHGSAGCGAQTCPQERVRAAFGAGNSVSLYLCDLDTTSNASTNCTKLAGTATYATGKAVDGVTPIMTFAAMPSALDAKADTRVFVLNGGHIYYGWQEKLSADSSTLTRLNDVAFTAVAKQLGITAPAASAISPYIGMWTVAFTGDDAGTCASVTVDASGALSGTCTSTAGTTLVASGTVSAAGVASFTTTGVSFSGTFSAASAKGTWSDNGDTGQWTATKQ